MIDLDTSDWLPHAPATGNLRLWVRQRFAQSHSSLAGALHALLERDGVADLPRIAEARRSVVGRLTHDDLSLAVKRYEFPRAFVLRTWNVPTRARREAANLAWVNQRIDNAVDVVAWAEVRSSGFVPRCWIVTTELQHARDLRALKHMDPADRDAHWRPVAEALPGWVAALHRDGLWIGTLRGKNVLVAPDPQQVALIDVPYAQRRAAPLHRELRVHDLASLYHEVRRAVDDAAWRDFLARYLEDGEDLDAWATEIAARTDHMAQRSWPHRAVRGLRRRLKRTTVGRWVTGHRYESPDGRPS